MISVFILAIMMLSLYASFNSGFGTVAVTREELRATQIMTQKLKAIRLLTWSQLPTAPTTVSDEFVDQPQSNLTQLLGVVGGKINLGGTFLLNLSLLFPLNDDGLKAKPTPVVGFDYVF